MTLHFQDSMPIAERVCLMNIIIENGLICTATDHFVGDIVITGDTITAITAHMRPGKQLAPALTIALLNRNSKQSSLLKIKHRLRNHWRHGALCRARRHRSAYSFWPATIAETSRLWRLFTWWHRGGLRRYNYHYRPHSLRSCRLFLTSSIRCISRPRQRLPRGL